MTCSGDAPVMPETARMPANPHQQASTSYAKRWNAQARCDVEAAEQQVATLRETLETEGCKCDKCRDCLAATGYEAMREALEKIGALDPQEGTSHVTNVIATRMRNIARAALAATKDGAE